MLFYSKSFCVNHLRKGFFIPLRLKNLLCAFLICGFSSFAQVKDVNFEHFTVRDGLPSQQIYNCFQDGQGFLWIGTDAGVSRFDGRAFENFSINDGLGDNEIHEIFQDTHGRIWFIPFSGKLSYYYHGKIYGFDIDALLKEPTQQVDNHLILAEDDHGSVFLAKAGRTRVVQLRGVGSKPVIYDLSPMLSGSESVSVFYSPAKSQIFCITNCNRLVLLKDGKAKDVTPLNFLADEKPYKFYTNHKIDKGYILFSSANGIYKLTGSGAGLLIPRSKIPFSEIPDLVNVQFDSFNNLWLNHLNHNTLFYKYTNGGYPCHAAILNNAFALVSLDNENNIWFTTTDGLYKTTHAKLQDKLTFDINSNLVTQKVISCVVDNDGGLWLGYNNGFITRIKGNSVKHYDLIIERRKNNRIVQIKVNREGNLLVATDESLFIIKRLDAGTYSRPLCFRETDGSNMRCVVKNIFFDKQGEAFLTHPFANGVFQANTQSVSVSERYSNHTKHTVRRFFSFFDRQGRLYTSTINGFTVLEKDGQCDLARYDARLKARIQDVAQGSDGTIFLAAYNCGLIALKDKKVISEMPRFHNQNVICRRIYLRNDTLYAVTNYGIGILVFNRQKFELIKMLSVPDGLISTDANDLAFLGNRLFVATSQGVSSFITPLKACNPVSPPTLVLQNLKIDDSLFNMSREPELSYKTKLIRINFIAPVLDKPELTLYRYRLNSTDGWQTTQASFIEFSKLKPGVYAIEIQAKKYNSAWSLPGKITILIRPPFYNTVWFMCFAVFALTASLFLITRSFVHRKYRNQLVALQQKEAIEKERNRIAADIHDDIGAELTNIAILSQILNRSSYSSKDDTIRAVQKIEASANQVITKMNEVIWTLNTRSYTLNSLMSYIRNYLTSLSGTMASNLNISIAENTLVEYPLAAEYTRDIFLVVKELLQNAIKHSAANTVWLTISLPRPDILNIVYEDDGSGFDPLQASTGNGLNNIKRRVARNGGSTDIYAGIGKGCRIKITFPINKLNNDDQ